MPDGKTLLENSFVVNYSASKVDISGGKVILNLDFSAGTYQAVDKNSLSLLLIGKNVNQVNETINSNFGGQVSKTETNLWPFWVTSVPNSQKAINIELKF